MATAGTVEQEAGLVWRVEAAKACTGSFLSVATVTTTITRQCVCSCYLSRLDVDEDCGDRGSDRGDGDDNDHGLDAVSSDTGGGASISGDNSIGETNVGTNISGDTTASTAGSDAGVAATCFGSDHIPSDSGLIAPVTGGAVRSSTSGGANVGATINEGKTATITGVGAIISDGEIGNTIVGAAISGNIPSIGSSDTGVGTNITNSAITTNATNICIITPGTQSDTRGDSSSKNVAGVNSGRSGGVHSTNARSVNCRKKSTDSTSNNSNTTERGRVKIKWEMDLDLEVPSFLEALMKGPWDLRGELWLRQVDMAGEVGGWLTGWVWRRVPVGALLGVNATRQLYIYFF